MKPRYDSPEGYEAACTAAREKNLRRRLAKAQADRRALAKALAVAMTACRDGAEALALLREHQERPATGSTDDWYERVNDLLRRAS